MAGLASGSQAACAGAPRAGGPEAPRRWILPWLDARAPGPSAPVRGELGREAASACCHHPRPEEAPPGGDFGTVMGEGEIRKSS